MDHLEKSVQQIKNKRNYYQHKKNVTPAGKLAGVLHLVKKIGNDKIVYILYFSLHLQAIILI